MMNRFAGITMMLFVAAISVPASAGTWTEQPLISWGPDQSLRVYTNSDPNGAMVLFMGGGAFLTAIDAIDPNDRELAPFRNRGFAFAVLDYPTADGIYYQSPNSWDGAEAGLAQARASASTFGIDPDKIAVLGTSAGGNLAAYLGVLPNPPRAVGVVDGLLALDSYTTVSPPLHFGSMFGAHSQAAWNAVPLADKQSISPPFLAAAAPADVWRVSVGLYYGNEQGLPACQPVHWHDAANGCIHAGALAARGAPGVVFEAGAQWTHAEAFDALSILFQARCFSQPLADGAAGGEPFPVRIALLAHGPGGRIRAANLQAGATAELEVRPFGRAGRAVAAADGVATLPIYLAGMREPEYARVIEHVGSATRASGWLRIDPLP